VHYIHYTSFTQCLVIKRGNGTSHRMAGGDALTTTLLVVVFCIEAKVPSSTLANSNFKHFTPSQFKISNFILRFLHKVLVEILWRQQQDYSSPLAPHHDAKQRSVLLCLFFVVVSAPITIYNISNKKGKST
jgi:hypothetical protein